MKDKVDEFLDRIAQLESSGGKNTQHKTIAKGMHKGENAIGTYGLMPNTVNEIINRARTDGMELPEMEAVEKMKPKDKKAFLESNPDVEKAYARSLAERALTNQEGDEQKAAYSWLYGHNLTPQKIEKRDYMSEPYVQRYMKLKTPYFNMEGKPEETKLRQYLEVNPTIQNNTMNTEMLKSALAAQAEPEALPAPQPEPELAPSKKAFARIQQLLSLKGE